MENVKIRRSFSKELSEANFEIVHEPLSKPIECDFDIFRWNDAYPISRMLTLRMNRGNM